MELLLLIFLVLFTITFAFYQARSFKQLAPWVPSKTKMLEQALNQLNLEPGSKFLDLGSGDGRAIFLASKKGYQATGVEINIIVHSLAVLRKILGRHKANLILGNAYKQDISDYDVIYLYGLPENMVSKIIVKLKEAKPNCFLISYNFTLPGYTPQQTFVDGWRRVMIYKL